MDASLLAVAPFLALFGAVINGLFGRSLREPLPGIIASGAVLVGFFFAVVAFFGVSGDTPAVQVELLKFLQAGDFSLDLGFVIDRLSVVMALIITGVGFLIHIFSMAYMANDNGYSRYFSYLNLFIAAMLILVLGDSYVLMFVGWEGVGVASFLLIGFWYQERKNPDAARKAFIVNRVGDAGFLLAMFLTYKTFGTLNIAAVNAAAPALMFGFGTVTAIGLLYLIAAAGKSAQLPLQVWLPDAMAGPTPVSALIHAATMVTAGVYLIARNGGLFAMSPEASATVAWIGGLTALIAAIAAITQTDIKKVLAYSTISQVGFMIVAAGTGAYWVAIFHLLTHAFFKALLFLASGSVIHALGGEQDMRKMGGLAKYLPVTRLTSLIGVAAIAGVPLFAGFFSKDAIMVHAFTSPLIADFGGVVVYGMLLLAALGTAFYMFRWYWLTFEGDYRGDAKLLAKANDGSGLQTVPLIVLAAGSILTGFLGLPAVLGTAKLQTWLAPVVQYVEFPHLSAGLEWVLILVSIAIAAAGLLLGYVVYAKNNGQLEQRYADSALAKLARAGLGFDAAYNFALVKPLTNFAGAVRDADELIVDRFFRLLGPIIGFFSQATTRIQSGFTRGYAFLMMFGVFIILVVLVVKGVMG